MRLVHFNASAPLDAEDIATRMWMAACRSAGDFGRQTRQLLATSRPARVTCRRCRRTHAFRIVVDAMNGGGT